jgi:hypothetical protein
MYKEKYIQKGQNCLSIISMNDAGPLVILVMFQNLILNQGAPQLKLASSDF